MINLKIVKIEIDVMEMYLFGSITMKRVKDLP